jgi:hypothetical protein
MQFAQILAADLHRDRELPKFLVNFFNSQQRTKSEVRSQKSKIG